MPYLPLMPLLPQTSAFFRQYGPGKSVFACFSVGSSTPDSPARFLPSQPGGNVRSRPRSRTEVSIAGHDRPSCESAVAGDADGNPNQVRRRVQIAAEYFAIGDLI